MNFLQKIEGIQKPWWTDPKRPLPFWVQELWVLREIRAGRNPIESSTRSAECPDWKNVLLQLRRKGQISETSLTLTPAGEDMINEWTLLNPNGPPTPEPFRVLLAPIATGSAVREDEDIYNRLNLAMRKVKGIEMEGVAIGAVAEFHDLPFVVAKGVQDYGNTDKDDRFRTFAARASAEWILYFLRQVEHVAPARDSTIDTDSPREPEMELPALSLDDNFVLRDSEIQLKAFVAEVYYDLCAGRDTTFSISNGGLIKAERELATMDLRKPEDRLRRVRLLDQCDRARATDLILRDILPEMLLAAESWALAIDRWGHVLVRNLCAIARSPMDYRSCLLVDANQPTSENLKGYDTNFAIEIWRDAPSIATSLTLSPYECSTLIRKRLTPKNLMVRTYDLFHLPSPVRARLLPMVSWDVFTKEHVKPEDVGRVLISWGWKVGLH